MITFDCLGCGHKLRVKDELAGQRGKCPTCKRVLAVPRADGLAGAAAGASLGADLPTLLPGRPADRHEQKTLAPGTMRGGPADGAPATLSPGAAARTAGVSPELYDFLAPPESDDELGRLGGYRVLKVLGAGGMGVVYLAEDPQLQRRVAVKAMLPALAASPSNRERFLREARAVAALEHDHVVSILQVGEDRNVPFLAMPFLKGESLEDRLRRERRLPLEEVLRIGRETALGLAAAHDHGLIHRDIKPANLWLESGSGRVKILDFGLARSTGQDSQLTQQGAIIGTPAYMAPEQARGGKVDARADLFSLGCVLYRMATGQPPFKGKDTIATLLAVASEHPTWMRKLNPEVPPALSDLVMKLLGKAPSDRPESARKVIGALAAIERGETGEDREDEEDHTEVIEAGGRRGTDEQEAAGGLAWLERSWPWLAGGGVGLVLLLVLALVLFRGKPGTDTSAEGDQPGGSGPGPALGAAKGFDLPQAHREPVRCLVFARTGDRLVSLDFHTLKLWGVTGGKELAAFADDQAQNLDRLACAAISPDGTVASCSSSGILRFHDPATLRVRRTVKINAGLWAVGALAFSPDGNTLAAANGKSVRLLDAATGDLKDSLHGHQGAITSLAFAADGTLWTAGHDRTVRHWDVGKLAELGSVPGPPGADVYQAQLAADGRLTAWRFADGSAHVTDTAGGKELSAVTGQAVQALDVCSKSGLLATGCNDGFLRVWATDTGAKRAEIRIHPAAKAVQAVALSPDGRSYAAAADTRLHLGTLAPERAAAQPAPANPGRPGVTRAEAVRFEGHTNRVSRVLFLDDNRIFSAGPDNTGRIWDCRSGKEFARLTWRPKKFLGDVTALTVVQASQRLFLATHDGMRVFDLGTLREQPRFPLGQTPPPPTAAFSPDGRRAYSSLPAEKSLQVWDAETGKALRKVADFGAVRGLALSPDGKRALAWGAGDNSIAVWDLTEFRLLKRLKGNGSQVLTAVFSPDGRQVLSTSLDQTVRLWDAESGEQIRELLGHETFCWGVAFSPDGRLAVTGSEDNVIRLFDLASGRLIHRFEGHTAAVTTVAFAPGGRFIASGSKDKTVRLWQMPK